ncbi:MAG TPA: hypothetical protein VFB45_07735 [Pseudolabrys sp.]|nr:hypothetical protein [Pseudolabrys sp.]
MRTNDNRHADYIGDMAHELAEMARTDGLDRLAYLLEMVKIEAAMSGEQCHDASRR